MSYADEVRGEIARTVQTLDEMEDIAAWRTAAYNLGNSLYSAAALFLAWELGQLSDPEDDRWVPVGEFHVAKAGSWFPGCGTVAPGFGKS